MTVTYHLDAVGDEASVLAEAVCLEQSVETPRAVAAREPFVREHLLGRVQSLEEDASGGTQAVISLPDAVASDPAQLLNVLFGNAALLPRVELVDFVLPPAVSVLFDGPRFGVAGLRDRAGVAARALTASALKPVGLSVGRLAALCGAFADGGIDVIKDDHYLADQAFSPFDQRVRACRDAVEEAAAHTGRRALYFPHLSGTPDAVRRQADVAQEAGVGGVLVCPLLLGLPAFFELVQQRLEVPVLAHPSYAGLRMRPSALLGRLFRLFGADAVIFPNYGGRFNFTPGTCAAIAQALREPRASLRPALPVPAGGMTVERAAELVDFFGPNTMLLVGGSLLEAGEALPDRVRELVAAVASASEPRSP